MYKRIFYDRKHNHIDLWECNGTKTGHHIHCTPPFEYWLEDPEGKSPIKDIYGTPMVQHQSLRRREMMANVEGSRCAETDLAMDVKFLHQRYEKQQLVVDMSQINIAYIDIEIAVANEFPKPSLALYPINLITIKTSYDQRVVTFGLQEYTGNSPAAANYVYCSTEQRLLEKFIAYFRRCNVDIITGWNVKAFDVQYIVKRCARLGIEKNMSPVNVIEEDKFGMPLIGAIAILDYMELYKKYRYKTRERYSLNYIAKLEIGEGKKDYEGTLLDLYKRDWNAFVEYNIQDVLLVERLEARLKYIELAVQICSESLIPFDKIFSTIAMHTGFISKYLHLSDRVMPPRTDADDADYPGAFVYAVNGMHKYVVSFDVTSLYPHMIMMYNIGPETLRLNPSAEEIPNLIRTPIPGTYYDKSRTSVLSEIVSTIFQDRKRLQAKLKMCRNEGKSVEEIAASLKRPVEDIRVLQQEIESENGNSSFYDSRQLIRKIMINCFHPETEIVTCTGIKKISDVCVGENVYSINPNTGMLEIKPVEHTYEYDYDGELEVIDNRGTQLAVTPEHKMLSMSGKNIIEMPASSFVKRPTNRSPLHKIARQQRPDTFCLLSYINVSDYYVEIQHTEHLKRLRRTLQDAHISVDLQKIPKRHHSRIVSGVTNETIQSLYAAGYKVFFKPKRDGKCKSTEAVVSRKHFSRFIGYYLSEGSLYESATKTYGDHIRGVSKNITITQSKKVNPQTYNDIVAVMSHIFTHVRLSDMTVSSSSDVWGDLIQKSFGAVHHKHIFGTAISDELDKEELFGAMYAGDGVKGRRCYVIGIKNTQLFNDTMRLLVEMARLPRYSIDTKSQHPSYRICWNTVPLFSQASDYTKQNHVGKVYNLTVADNHTVLVGTNGKFSWTGQSLYGALGCKAFHFYNTENAKAITLGGQDLIKYMSKCFNDYFRNHFWKNKRYFGVRDEANKIDRDVVVLIDTDSNYITLEPIIEKLGLTFANNADFHAWATQFVDDFINPFIDSVLDIYAKKYGVKQIIQFKREKIASQMLITSKKHYAIEIVDSEGTIYDPPKLSITGIELVKTDTPAWVRQEIIKILRELFAGKSRADVLVQLAELRRAYMKEPQIEKLAEVTSVNTYKEYAQPVDFYLKEGVSYPSRCPKNVRASINYNYIIAKYGLPLQPIDTGTKICFVTTTEHNLLRQNVIGFINQWPPEFDNLFTIDRHEMWDRTVVPLVQSFFDAMKWDEVAAQHNTIMTMFS